MGMAILGNFEVSILTPTYDTDDYGHTRTEWQAIPEHNAPGNPTDGDGISQSTKYICAPCTFPRVEPEPGPPFAVDFKTQCGFEFTDTDEAKYLTFRIYLDDEKIGSAFIKRDRWQRSGSYKVRKTGRRLFMSNTQSWIRQDWAFDRGLHGNIMVEVWRQRDRQPSMTGSWNFPDLLSDRAMSADYVDLTNSPYKTRVRYTAKIDPFPLATFRFEYRSKETIQNLGLIDSKAAHTAEADTEDEPHNRKDSFSTTIESPSLLIEEDFSMLGEETRTTPQTINTLADTERLTSTPVPASSRHSESLLATIRNHPVQLPPVDANDLGFLRLYQMNAQNDPFLHSNAIPMMYTQPLMTSNDSANFAPVYPSGDTGRTLIDLTMDD